MEVLQDQYQVRYQREYQQTGTLLLTDSKTFGRILNTIQVHLIHTE